MSESSTRTPGIRALVWTACIGAVLLFPLAYQSDASLWSGLAPADCLEYCEGSHRCGALADRAAIQQPLNTASNLIYLFLGLAVALRRRDLEGWVFAGAMGVLCIGSGLFHASMTRAGQWLDVAAMYFVLNALVGFAFHVHGLARFARTLPFFLAFDVLLAAFKWGLPMTPVLALLGGVVFAVLLAGVRRGALAWSWALAPTLIFLLGYGIRELDVQRVGCDPASWLYQGHAVWHLTSALFLWGTFVALERLEGTPRNGGSRSPEGSG